MSRKEFNVVGKRVPREDGYAKASGKAKFADDFSFPGQLYGIMLRTGEVHAVIKNVDYSKIEGDVDLVAICDATDIKGDNVVGLVKDDQPVFCGEKVVTAGDVIAMLIGPSPEKLKSLADRVIIDYEVLPLLTDPLKSLSRKSPLIHPANKSNLIVHHKVRKGNVNKAFRDSAIVLERTYTTSLVEHAYIEPESVTALPEKGGRLKIIGSIQNPHTALRIVCRVLNEKPENINIVQAELGGSFGGKDDTMCILAARAAVAARKVRRPVKIRYSREESVTESYKRHPYIMRYKAGVDRNGRINAMKIDITADGGAYASMSPFVTWRSVVQATGPYRIPNVKTDVKAVYTNNPYTGAFRGFGSPQPIFAVESFIDEIASLLNISPIEIRRRNLLKKGSETATGQILDNHEVTLERILDRAEVSRAFEKRYQENLRKNKKISRRFIQLDPATGLSKDALLLGGKTFIGPDEKIRKGIGMAVSYRGCSLGAEGADRSAAVLRVMKDGSIKFISGLTENGQGLRTTFAMIISEVLGVSMESVSAMEQSTRIAPDSGPTVASRATLMGGGAVKKAADEIKRRLSGFLIKHYRLGEGTRIRFKDNLIYLGENGRKLKFVTAVQKAIVNGIRLSLVASYGAPEVSWKEDAGQGDAYFTYVYGCQVAEVEVDISTGAVNIERITAYHDPGRVINKSGAEGQVYGGVTQGAGYAIMEEINPVNGRAREDNFDQLLIPTSKDIGDIRPVFIEGEEPHGAWGGKSLGEPTLELTAAAVANAVANATGRRYYSLPLNLEEILLGFKLTHGSTKRGSLL